ncbi:MAG: metal-dependent transcriptional regulator [Oscillospiraceae bacterium]|jgi:Mn-dependent DtxR family transcriptional regulator|nr:metal-dependent transcriptional regulator [Oscillospiraceae bacterium]
MKIQESAENYLETILILSRKHPGVRSIDIADEMGFSKPSVSVAMKKLRENSYITVDDGGFITLTDTGKEIAVSTYAKHVLLRDWLISLGVTAEVAELDACRAEHVLSQESINALRGFLSLETEVVQEIEIAAVEAGNRG